MEKLFNYQFDFVKIKVKNVSEEQVKWKMLKKHPAINNTYLLSDESTLHGKNFKLHFRKNNDVILETSIPYLNHNHNYVETSSGILRGTLEYLSLRLGINFIQGTVMIFEYGVFQNISIEAPHYLSKIIGIGSYDLKYNSSFMKIYGNSNIHFKIYDAVGNAKKKKTFTRGKYPTGRLIKHELKFINPSKYFNKSLLVDEMCEPKFEQKVKSLLKNHIDTIVHTGSDKIEPKGNSMMCLLYASLKQYELTTGLRARTSVIDIIDNSSLSPSQKSKRRNTVSQLESLYHNSQKDN